MIWFRLRELERHLAHNALSEKAALNYLLTYLVFIMVLIYLPAFSGYSNDWYYFVELVLVLFILLFTLYKAFRINEEKGNRDFLKRTLSLSFVIGLRLGIIFSMLYLFYKIVMFIIPLEIYVIVNDFTTGDLQDLMYSLLIAISYHFMLMKSFERISYSEKKLEAQLYI